MNYALAVDLIRGAVPDTDTVYLFGSRAGADNNPASDVDLAFVARSSIEPVVRFDLQERIAAVLHTSVDLIEPRDAPGAQASSQHPDHTGDHRTASR